MAEPEVEAAWRAEFERSGAAQLRDALNSGAGFTDELKRQAAFRWLGDEAEAQRLQQEQTYHYVNREAASVGGLFHFKPSVRCSLIGPKPTCKSRRSMSAYRGEADLTRTARNVC